MLINIILPFATRVPGGGHKIIYEYANRLQERGHVVNLYHPIYLKYLSHSRPLLVKFIGQYLTSAHRPKWFNLSNKVNSYLIPFINNFFIKDADVIIATWWSTASPVNKLSSAKGNKYYYIQHYENWDGPVDKLHESYSMGLRNIITAPWLKEIIEKHNGIIHAQVPYGLDFDVFKVTNRIESRENTNVSMLYHFLDWKGAKDGMYAILKAKEKFDKLSVKLFGVVPRPSDLPEWIEYYYKPDITKLVEIYNNSSIFICPSWHEGWGLPSCEAMSCGCALLSTKNGGVEAYTIENENVILCEPQNPNDLYEKLLLLLSNQDLRIKIAKYGYSYIRTFTWDKSVELFYNAIKQE